MADAELHDGGPTSLTLVFLLKASSARFPSHGSSAAGFFSVRMFGWLPWRGRLLDSCFRISSRPDMNSRAAGRRSHRSRIRSREAVSERNGGIEAADERKQRRVGHGLIPVIENAAERRPTPLPADGDPEAGPHPHQG